MPRTFVALTVGGLLLALLAAVLVRPSLAFTLGVDGTKVAAVLAAGAEVCERPVEMPPDGAFDRVVLTLETYSRPGPELRVRVKDDRTGAPLASGRLAGGYGDGEHTVHVRTVDTTKPLSVCVANAGAGRVGVVGGRGDPVRPPHALLGGRRLLDDLDIAFEREPRSLLSQAPAIAERAALFRPGWVGPWTYVVLVLILAVAVPALLAAALAGLRDDPRQ